MWEVRNVKLLGFHVNYNMQKCVSAKKSELLAVNPAIKRLLLSCTFSLNWSELAAWLEIFMILVTSTHNLQSNLWKLLAVIWGGQWLFRSVLISGFVGVQGVSLCWHHSESCWKDCCPSFFDLTHVSCCLLSNFLFILHLPVFLDDLV